MCEEGLEPRGPYTEQKGYFLTPFFILSMWIYACSTVPFTMHLLKVCIECWRSSLWLWPRSWHLSPKDLHSKSVGCKADGISAGELLSGRHMLGHTLNQSPCPNGLCSPEKGIYSVLQNHVPDAQSLEVLPYRLETTSSNEAPVFQLLWDSKDTEHVKLYLSSRLFMINNFMQIQHCSDCFLYSNNPLCSIWLCLPCALWSILGPHFLSKAFITWYQRLPSDFNASVLVPTAINYPTRTRWSQTIAFDDINKYVT